MPDVFTIYNCGTAFNRQRTDELVANLASRTQGAENRDWIVNDGPGSAPSKPAGPLPGDRSRAAQAHTPGHGPGDANPQFVTQAHGLLTGHGWEENVAHTMKVLEAQFIASKSPPRVVNMVGWSRGAITCHMIANALQGDRRFSGVQVNIFAVDPVAGPGNTSDPDKVSIPPNVNEYFAIAMEDESRFIMRPSFPAAHQAGGSRHVTYAMPGNHSAAVMLREGPVAEITHNLALDFLNRHGTTLSSHIRLAPEKVCELYAMVRLTLERYRPNSSGVLSAIGNAFSHGRAQDIPNPERTKAFLNRHHETVFKAAYPNIATYISMSGKGTPPIRDLERIKQRWEATHRWLHAVVRVPAPAPSALSAPPGGPKR